MAFIQIGSNGDDFTFQVPTDGTTNWGQSIRTLFFNRLRDHDHSGAGNGKKLGASSFLDNAMNGTKFRLQNNEWLRARNAADTADQNLIRLNSSNVIEFAAAIAPGDNTISTAKLQDNAVTNAKMADNSVNTAELVNDSVTTAKILNANVTTNKIADGAITQAKRAALNLISSSPFTASNATTTFSSPVNITITTTGRPICFGLRSNGLASGLNAITLANSSSGDFISGRLIVSTNSDPSITADILYNTSIGMNWATTTSLKGLSIPASSFNSVQPIAAGTYTLYLHIRAGEANTTISLPASVVFYAYEL